jgi:hypothetical protein
MNNETEIIQIMPVDPTAQRVDPAEEVVPTWNPVLGIEFDRYVSKLNNDHRARLEVEAPHVLEACVRPNELRSNAGLVLGYVQSGKTSSFQAVAALAKDNKYRAVVVIGGTSNLLLKQTKDRFFEDLDLTKDDVPNRWIVEVNPRLDTDRGEFLLDRIENIASILNLGQEYSEAIPLIFVMKNSTHLDNLAKLLDAASGPDKNNLRHFTTLVIDDEAHMHTPNIKKDAIEVSRIYSLIRTLRSFLPSHSLLQYTATPQANLLAALDDEFSPNFVRLLGYGPDYAGGKKYFVDMVAETVRSIPADEQIRALSASEADPSPESLRQALAAFLIVSASDRHSKTFENRVDFNRFSMLVHAAGLNINHQVFTAWLSSLISVWKMVLDPTGNSEDRSKLLDKYFAKLHEDIEQTSTSTIPTLDSLVPHICTVLSTARLWEINQRGDKDVNWSISNYNIINGGDLLGVGFTIKRLFVTHMMRKPGGNQIDTIQQRGRFFGYNLSWIDKTRIWITDDVSHQFKDYVVHEETLRSDLQPYDQENLSLRNWKRRFRMNPSAKLCRRNAIRIDVNRFETDSSWTKHEYRVDDEKNRVRNRTGVDDFLLGRGIFQKQITMSPADPDLCGAFDPSNPGLTQHSHGTCSINELLLLLAEHVVREEDRDNFEMLRIAIEEYASNEKYSSVDVFLMAGQSLSRRKRTVQPNGKLFLMQGHNKNYVGDRNVRIEDRIAVQIHRLDHNEDAVFEEDSIYLAVSLPKEIEDWAIGWVMQVPN